LAGIYIHIPFCSQFCIYCDFYSVKQTGRIKSFIESLLCEIEQRRDFFFNCNSVPTTIYIGGGTPSLLTPEYLTNIIDSLRRNFQITDMSKIVEFTMEVNPDDVTEEYLSKLKSLGVNRLSMGIQSFADEDLRWMNRRHDSAQAIEAFHTARRCGFDNISLDLIFGYNLLSEKKWINNLNTMTNLRPEHISSYQLGIEKGTKLFGNFASGEYRPLSEDISYSQYSILQRKLAEAGYLQYEISNFALPGREARHNSSYWDYTPYIGLGPSAHTFNGSVRSWNCSNLSKYNSLLISGQSCSQQEMLTSKDIFNERVMLSLRRVVGLDLKVLEQESGGEMFSLFLSQLEEVIKRGLVVRDGYIIKIPSDKLFVSDGIIRDLIL